MKIMTLKSSPILWALLLFFTFSTTAAGQNISGIINSYTTVTGLDSCQSKLTVSGTTGFTVGVGVILIQMNGASMLENDNSSFGSITDLRKVGYFEANVVDSIAGNEVYLRYSIANIYDFQGIVQLVTYPTYGNAIVTDTLRPKAWDGTTGGVLAFQATQLTLNAPIDATGRGFRGGAAPNPFTDCVGGPGSSAANYVYSRFDQEGAPKGEGVAKTINGKENGRGSQGNGGGGGNNHNAGGGGGSNISAGGLGGRNKEPALFGCYGNNPGLGSYALQIFNDRAYMGGGGGAGHDNNRVATSGGNGGGIVIIKATTINSTVARNILANGADARESGGDGGGGGGGGGTIVLEANTVGNLVSLSVKGGNGGNANNSGANRCQGPGGGGGGGRILVNLTSIAGSNINVAGGTPGNSINSSASNCPISSNGGLSGEVGLNTQLNQTSSSIIRLLINDRVYRTHTVFTQPVNKIICVNKNDTIKSVIRGQNMRFQWQMDSGAGFQDLTNGGNFANVNTPNLAIVNAPQNISTNRFRCVTTGGCVTTTVLTTNEVVVTITPRPTATFTPNIVAGTNAVTFTNTSINATSYRWQFGGGATATTANASYTFPTQGNYTVTLTAYNNCDSFSVTQSVILNSRPISGFQASTTDYCVPAQVSYQSQTSQNTTGWRWIFQGGSPATSTDVNPVVNYTTAGAYDVTLIASNPNGFDTLSRAAYVRVNGVPNPTFTWQRNVQTVSFTNSTTGSTSFLWNFGNGQTSTLANPQITFAAGTYIVSLTATNACGTSTRNDTLVLLGLPNASILTNVREGCSPLRVQYVAQNPINVSNWRWTFTGGSPSSSSVQNPLVTYTTPGVYSATVVMTNSAGNTTYELTNHITVRETPRADFSATVSGTVVEFTNRSFGAVASRWDFGNGDVQVRNEPIFSYIYNRNGLFQVTLTVTNPYCGAATSHPVAINYTDVKNINDPSQMIDIFPNPTLGIINLRLLHQNAVPEDGKIQLFSAIGERVATFPLVWNPASAQQLDISNLPSGVYWLKIESSKMNVMKKIVKL
ncbi:MAG: hypothetical protein RL757_511 [Bacteroidota bacterium]